MALYRLQVRIPWASGLSEDVTVNVFHFEGVDDADAEAFGDALVTFYETVDTYFSNIINSGGDACSVTGYDLGDAIPRVPVFETRFTMASAIGAPIPPENAIVLSFQGVPVSGQAQARRRGRVYLGPIEADAVETTGRPKSTVITGIRDAAQDLLDTANGIVGGGWVVYSPTADDTTSIVDGWVDDEFDHQLRRGRKPTTRAPFAA